MTSSVFKGNSRVIESVKDLVAYVQAGETATADWRVGTEHEKIGFYRHTRRPIPYGGERGIQAILDAFADRFGWERIQEEGNTIALQRGAASITLEPGGQVELSGAAVKTAHESCAELAGHLAEIQDISEPLGIVWLTLGRNPFIEREEMPWVPKQRYRIMRDYLPTRGSMGLDMMVSTGTVQTNIDYADEADMARKFRVGLAAAPILHALFANSPFASGRPGGYLSSRGQIWMNTDPDRGGAVPGALADGFTYRDYVEYALDVPMFFIYRDGKYRNYAGRSFRRFLQDGLDGHRATLEDWELHLTTLFPEVRMKQWLELRMCDSGSREMICALTALTRGIFYDETALADAFLLLGDVRGSSFTKIFDEAAHWGLDAAIGDRPLRDWAHDLVEIGSAGLKRLNALNAQGRDERIFLTPLEYILHTGKSHAAVLMDLWKGAWNESLDPLFTESYFH